MKKFVSTLLGVALIFTLAACGGTGSEEPDKTTPPENTTPLSESEIKDMYIAPDLFTGRPIELIGTVFGSPEYYTDAVYFQMWGNPEQESGNTVVQYESPDFEVEPGDIVHVTGTVGGSFHGDNIEGSELKAAVVIAESVEIVPPAEPTVLEDYIPAESFFSYSGTGDDVVTGLTVEKISYLKVTHIGSGHFAIKAHYNDLYDLLINTTDPYDGGCTLLYPNTEYVLEVTAKGAWDVAAFELGTSSTDTFSGTGDVVTPICISTSDVYEITAPGGGHFAVKGYHADGRYDLLVNTTDSYSGKVMFKNNGDLCFFEVTGEREFSIAPQ